MRGGRNVVTGGEPYVEFPVDPIVNVHWRKKKHDGGGGGEQPPVQCGGQNALTWSPVFPESASAPEWLEFGNNFASAAGEDGVPDMATFDVSVELDATEIPFDPPYTWPRPAYTYTGLQLLIGISNDGGASYSTVASDGGGTVQEGGSFSASASYQMPATKDVDAMTAVAFAVTYESASFTTPWWMFNVGLFLFGTASTDNVVLCTFPDDRLLTSI